MKIVKSDVCIIGSGIAGLSAAHTLSKAGVTVAVVSKSAIKEGNTLYAQGGIAVAMQPEDKTRYHYEDTIAAGAGHCHPDRVKILVEEGPCHVQELIRLGASFDSDGQGLSYTKEGAHRKRRILHVADATGREIEKTLGRHLLTQNKVRFFAHTMIIELLGDQDGYRSAIGQDQLGQWVQFQAKAILLATGGACQMYRHNTNPPCATGDGIALASQVGAELADMEFVQFHPTTLYSGDKKPISLFLISEAVRGEGALLRNIKGERFMPDYHDLAELAPRDVVSRAIFMECQAAKSPYVYLDLSHLDVDIPSRFPTIYQRCLSANIDLTREWVPVCPAAHYMIGGVKTDEWGATNVEGLYAAGEVASTGVHGANRLASNSLLEGLVFGARAATHLSEEIVGRPLQALDVKPKEQEETVMMDCQWMKEQIRHWMWEDVGICRTRTGLERVCQNLEGLSIPTLPLGHRMGVELQNMHCVATQCVAAALARPDTIGAHYIIPTSK